MFGRASFATSAIRPRDLRDLSRRRPREATTAHRRAPRGPRSLEVAEEVPPANVNAHVRRGHGNRYTLAYKIRHDVPGTKVRFVERGRDSTHVLGVVSAARGALSFTPQDALGRHRRTKARRCGR